MENAKKQAPSYTIGEEIFNSISHGVGVLVGISALVLLIVFSCIKGNGYSLAAGIVYGTSLIVLYSMSMVYHIVQGEKAKAVLRIFDHCSIFVLIAGTYTPYLLVSLDKTLGWVMFGIIWGMAVFGILLNAINLEKFKKVSMVCYVVMGWAVIFTIKPILEAIALPGFLLLALGGIIYTAGIFFYRAKNHKYMHSVWHLFVLAGSICHYLSILFYVVLKN